MSAMRLEGAQTVSAIEERYGQLSREEDVDVLIARKMDSWRLGGKAALIQFIATWSKRTSWARLLTHVQGLDAEDLDVQLENLALQDHGLAAFLMADEVLTRGADADITATARRYAQDELDKMERAIGSVPGTVRRGPKAILLCADHFSHLLRHFYYANGRVRSEREFAKLIQQLIQLITSNTEGRTGTPLFEEDVHREVFDELGSIFYELFANTEEWATTDAEGVPLRRSIRGLLIEIHNDSFDNFLQISEGSPTQQSYVSHLAERLGDRGRFLEVSVFDSGPGLAARGLGRDWEEEISLRKEFAACLKCLRKWKTTTHQSHRGVGLVRVMRNLTQLDGFWRIRTGRLSLCRDFASRPYNDSRKQELLGLFDDPDLVDWYTGSEGDLTPLERAEGLLVTMLIPLSHR